MAHYFNRLAISVACFLVGVTIYSNSSLAEELDSTIELNIPYSGTYEVQRNDLVRERLEEWRTYTMVSNNTIRVDFVSGDKKCYGHRAVLQETDDTIAIAIITGAVNADPLQMCALYASKAAFLLQTRKPIAGRAIIPLTSVPLKP